MKQTSVRRLVCATIFLLAFAFLPSQRLHAQTANKQPTTRPRARARAARPRGPVRGEAMDYGPFVSYSVLRPLPPKGAKPAVDKDRPHAAKTDGGELLAVRGINIRVAKDAYVCFDTDLLSLAGAWTGGFLDMSRSNIGQYKGDFPPRVKGTLQFSTLTDPGWANSDGSFTDTRPDHMGPIPHEWGHYKGLYRNGEKVILSYSIGNTDVLEMEGCVERDGDVAFTRTFHLGGSKRAEKILLCEGLEGDAPVMTSQISSDGRSTTIDSEQISISSHESVATNIGVLFPPGGGRIEVNKGRAELFVPARTAPADFTIVISHAPVRSFDGIMKSLVKVEDLPALCHGGPSLWNDPIITHGSRGADTWAYTVDTVALPEQNPWKSWMRTSAVDFFPDGRAAVATFSGDVWIVSGLDDKLDHVTWRRFAAGLYEPLGLRIVDGQIYVLGRDQITRLHDLNGDGEADFYENFCNAWTTSPIYHAFLMDLQTDSAGNFYFSTCGNQAPMDLRLSTYGYILKVPKAGNSYERFANGLRAANGLGMGPHDELVTADNQGNWTPVDRINLVRKGGFYGFYYDPRRIKKAQLPELHFPNKYDPPICWIRYPNPDNSAGAQVWGGPNWGPLSGKMLCLSYGQSDVMEVLWEQRPDGTPQGGVFKLPLKFESGIMRARVNPKDGQVWVCGLKGWQTNAVHDGCLQRIRYTGKPAHIPDALQVTKDGLAISFTDALDPTTATDPQNYGIEQWNYHWTETYGSKEYKLSNPDEVGHDDVDVAAARLSPDHKTVTLAIKALQPVMQMAIQMNLKAADGAPVEGEIDNTINEVGQ